MMKQPKYIELVEKLKKEFPDDITTVKLFLSFFSKATISSNGLKFMGFNIRKKRCGSFEITLWHNADVEATTKFLNDRKLSRYIKKEGE